jgi:hypothetical protein
MSNDMEKALSEFVVKHAAFTGQQLIEFYDKIVKEWRRSDILTLLDIHTAFKTCFGFDPETCRV